jgi:predicted RNA binding protein YcfA (HicA-like mRNA interferase family)
VPKLPSLTPRKLIRLLKKHAFVEDHQTGSHLILVYPSYPRPVVVPVHRVEQPFIFLAML